MSFFDPTREPDPRRCRVCGHLTVPPARRTLNALLLVVIGMLLMYITLDIARDGRLDERLFAVITSEAHASK